MIASGLEVHAHINLANLQHNFNLARSLAAQSKIMPVVKADAYGHGMVQVCQALNEADAFAVARVEEGVRLRAAGIKQPILVLGGFLSSGQLQTIIELDLQTVVQAPFQYHIIKSLGAKVSCWIKLDTGMNRLGLSAEDFAIIVKERSSLLDICALMSHFACADDLSNDMSARQMERFDELTTGLDYPISLANSAALMGIKESHRDWVRPGVMLYGASPFKQMTADTGLKPVMTLKAPLISVKKVTQGETVGYGASFNCKRDSVIGVVAIGYGDGYPRGTPTGTPVLVQGQKATLAGRVSMDLIAIDLTDLDKNIKENLQEGEPVTLWGEGLPVEEIATALGTIPYIFPTGLTTRVIRSYTETGT